MSLKKAQICIDALTQVDVIGLLIGTTGLAEMVDGISETDIACYAQALTGHV